MTSYPPHRIPSFEEAEAWLNLAATIIQRTEFVVDTICCEDDETVKEEYVKEPVEVITASQAVITRSIETIIYSNPNGDRNSFLPQLALNNETSLMFQKSVVLLSDKLNNVDVAETEFDNLDCFTFFSGNVPEHQDNVVQHHAICGHIFSTTSCR